jgi:acyl carrier protein phosphodiesterase
MNYLAHAYLSFRNPGILVGNMISDFVKGKKQFDYPLLVREGIKLHRAIDDFTDTHPATKEGKVFFKPAVGLYSGAFMDIVYDHFLALDETELTEQGWKDFALETYTQLSAHESFLPEKFARMLPYMRSQDWLYNYRFDWGISNSFQGLVRRAKFLDDAGAAFAAFTENYAALEQLYRDFFPHVKKFAAGELTARAIL